MKFIKKTSHQEPRLEINMSDQVNYGFMGIFYSNKHDGKSMPVHC